MSIAERFEVIADAVYENGKAAGQQTEYDRFWDAYQQNGERRDYTYSFAGNMWTDEIYNPKYDIIIGGEYGTNMFRANRVITDTKVPIRLLSGTSATYLFSTCTALVKIPLLEVTKNNVFTGWFQSCNQLVDITISGVIGNDINLQYSPLSKASITSVVNALSETMSGKTATFQKDAVVNAFGSTTAQEWLDLVATKQNWTISLV